jgi:hypothetical protein
MSDPLDSKPDPAPNPPSGVTDNPWNISEAALRLTTERPPFWGWRLFDQVLTDEIERSRSLLSSPPVGTRANIPVANFGDWMQNRLEVFQRIVVDIDSLAKSTSEKRDTPGPPDQPNVAGIITFSRKLAAFYRQTVEWVHSVRNAQVDPRWRKVAYELSFFADSTIRGIEAFAAGAPRQTESLIAKIESGAQPPSGAHALKFELDFYGGFDVSRVEEALRQATACPENTVPRAEVSTPLGEPGYLYILTNPSLVGQRHLASINRHKCLSCIGFRQLLTTVISDSHNLLQENRLEQHHHAKWRCPIRQPHQNRKDCP